MSANGQGQDQDQVIGKNGRADPQAGKTASQRGATRRSGKPPLEQVRDLLGGDAAGAAGDAGAGDTGAPGKAGASQGGAAGKAGGQAAQAGDQGAAAGDQGAAAGDQGAAAGDQGAAAGQDQGDQGAAAGDQAKAKPKTWKEAAERLGLEPDELYGLELNLAGDRGTMTLGQVKDLIQAHGAALPEISGLMASTKQAEAAAREQRETVNAEANVIRRDLIAVMGAMGNVPPQVLAEVRTLQAKRAERELRLTLDAVPEWRDPQVFRQDKAEIAEMLGRYGYSRAEFDAVDDSRLMLFLRDQVRARRAARDAIAKAGDSTADVNRNAQQPTGRGALSAGALNAARIAAARTGGRVAKTQAVAALLKGK